MSVLERPEAKRLERNRSRFFASELVDALRGRHSFARVVPVITGEIDEPEQKKKDGKAKFRVIGAHRGSKWSKASYAALVLSPEYLEPDGTTYQIKLDECAFESVRERLQTKSWACGLEHFYLSARTKHPVRTKACAFCELLAGWARVYKLEENDQVRNRPAITQDQAAIADLLLAAATITPITFSRN